MAQGMITVTTQSVDYPPPYGRGHIWLYNDVEWTVNGADISFRSVSSRDNAGGSWTLYNAIPGYDYRVVMEVQVDYGSGWQTIASASRYIGTVAEGGTNAIQASLGCIGDLGTHTLSRSCSMRILYYANASPAPTAEYPYAFPDSGYSAAVQVPVDIQIDYRPGAVRVNGAWKSTNRSGGKCHIRQNGTWVEMKTQDGGSTGNPPSRRASGSWKNQYKIGSE